MSLNIEEKFWQNILIINILKWIFWECRWFILTTADPTATPPAVAAICLNIDGCSATAVGAAVAGAGGWAGAVRAGSVELVGAALKKLCLKYYYWRYILKTKLCTRISISQKTILKVFFLVRD